MVNTDEVCREINKFYGCPIIPPKYTGQLEVGCRVFADYGHNIFFEDGVWKIVGHEKGIHMVKFIGDSNPYWPAYQYYNFSCLLIRCGVLPWEYFSKDGLTKGNTDE